MTCVLPKNCPNFGCSVVTSCVFFKELEMRHAYNTVNFLMPLEMYKGFSFILQIIFLNGCFQTRRP